MRPLRYEPFSRREVQSYSHFGRMLPGVAWTVSVLRVLPDFQLILFLLCLFHFSKKFNLGFRPVSCLTGVTER